jgi:hypothetical protein
LLSQYDAPWPNPSAEISITVESGLPPEMTKPAGDYLISYRLHVDRRGAHLISRSNVGVWMDFNEAEKRAFIRVPDHSDRETVIEEVEQQLVLLLARAWAKAGWTPLHAGSLIPPKQDRCIFVCAPSGVGKTTLVSAMLCRGWQTLGDDKILLRKKNGNIEARALSRRVHLHPSLLNWFPEIGAIEKWPRYSRWTEKRMAGIESIWPGQLLTSACPAGLVQLGRNENSPAIEFESLDPINVLHTLLRQIAIPADAGDAQPLLACAATLAAQLRGARLHIGNNAFADGAKIKQLEKIFLGLLP